MNAKLSGLQCLAVVLAVIGAIVAVVPEPARADMVGLVKRVKNDAFGTPPGAEREKKFLRFPVVQDELLETEKMAGMLVEFLDKTVLVLGPNSSLRVETFIYDPDARSVVSVFDMSIGMLHFISGKMNTAEMRITTPSAHVAIRGSDALIVVSPEGATAVSVFSGKFEVSNLDRSDRAVVTAAQTVSVSATGTVGAVVPGPTAPPGELDILSMQTRSVGPGEKDGGNEHIYYDPEYGLGDDHPDDDHPGDDHPGDDHPGDDHPGDDHPDDDHPDDYGHDLGDDHGDDHGDGGGEGGGQGH